MKRSIHPLAQQELIDGAVFYATRETAALGGRFVAEFERSVSLRRTHPELGAVWRGKYRRLRNPGYWRGRG